MATDKPRFSITMDPEMLNCVENYCEASGFATKSKAIVDLVKRGLDELNTDAINGIRIFPEKKAPSISDGALKLAKKYDALDSWGKQAVQDLVDTESARMEERRFLNESELKREPKVINLFLNPSAAGMALGITDADSEPYELKESDPQSAAYAVRLQGNSMEPDFPDGSIVFVNHDQMRDGDIGIFCVDGATVCKQWHYAGGITYLFSLNRKRADADLIIPMDSNRSLVWQGRVITKRRFPLPGV